MNPCFWNADGDVIEEATLAAGFDTDYYVPCRTVCQNGVLDIEEECEPFQDLMDAGDTCLEGVAKGVQYEYCSETCMCKEGWEINPDFDRDLAVAAGSNEPCIKVCGNDYLDPNEECEPASHNADETGNYCSSSCQCRPGWEINPDFV